MIQVYEINTDGTIKERYVLEENEAKEKGYITKELPPGLYKAIWNGTSWEEGATEEYIKSLSKNNTDEIQREQVTEDYLLDLDYRISKLEIGAE